MHQVSFALFAQQQAVCAPSATQTDEVQAVAAPASSGSGACSLVPFEGATRPFRSLHDGDVAGGWRGDWYIDWQASGALDAPEDLPAGSHVSMVHGVGERWCYAKAEGYAGQRGWL